MENLNFTGAGNFAGTGNTLANVIVGGAGNDTLDDGGVGGADTLNGGAGNDTYFIRNAGETILDSGAGVNTVNTTLLSYTLAPISRTSRSSAPATSPAPATRLTTSSLAAPATTH